MDIIGYQDITLNPFYTMMSEYDRRSVIAIAHYMHEAFTTRNKFLLDIIFNIKVIHDVISTLLWNI